MTAGYFELFYFLNVVCIIYFARINFIHHLLFMSVSPREVIHRLGLQSSNCSFVPQIILLFVTYMMAKWHFLSFEWRPVNSPVHPYQQRRTLTQAHTHFGVSLCGHLLVRALHSVILRHQHMSAEHLPVSQPSQDTLMCSLRSFRHCCYIRFASVIQYVVLLH